MNKTYENYFERKNQRPITKTLNSTSRAIELIMNTNRINKKDDSYNFFDEFDVFSKKIDNLILQCLLRKFG